MIISSYCRAYYIAYQLLVDPADIAVVTVECEGFPSCNARPLVISSHSSRRPSLPERQDDDLFLRHEGRCFGCKVWLRLSILQNKKSPESLVNKGNPGLVQQGMRESNP